MQINTEKYMCIRFRDGGRNFKYCDCRGLVGLILKEEFNIEIPDAIVSCREKSKINSIVRKEKHIWDKTEKPGWPCIILFCTENPGEIDHMGLYIGNNEFISIRHSAKYPSIKSLDDISIKYSIEGFYEPRK